MKIRLFILVCATVIGSITVLGGMVHATEWQEHSTGVTDILYDICFVDEMLGFATGWGSSSGGVILRTIDGGLTWDSTIPQNGTYFFSVTFTDVLTGYVGGCVNGGAAAAIFTTRDGGDTWTKETFEGCWGFYTVDFPSADTGYASGWNGRIYKTVNGGGDWTLLSSGTANPFRWMHFPTVSTGYAVCGSNYNNPTKIFKTVDGGVVWEKIQDYGTGITIGGIHFLDAETGVMVGSTDTEVILKTVDGGITWQETYRSSETKVIQGLFMECAGGWAVANGGRVFRTTDFGDTWILDTITSPVKNLLAVCQAGNTAFLATQGGTVFSSNPLNGIVNLGMPANTFSAGDPFGVDITVCNPGDALDSVLVFAILDVAGEYFFAPSWRHPPDGAIDAYLYEPLPSGETEITVIPEFPFPDGVPAMSGLKLYSALTDVSVSEIIWNLEIREFSFID